MKIYGGRIYFEIDNLVYDSSNPNSSRRDIFARVGDRRCANTLGLALKASSITREGCDDNLIISV